MKHPKLDPLQIEVSIKQEFETLADVDLFADEYIDKIESLQIMLGGGYNRETGLHSHVLAFVDDEESKNEAIVNTKLHELQKWILNHRFRPTILLWKEMDEGDLDAI